MADTSYLRWPFFEPRHAQFAASLDAWATQHLSQAHGADVDAECRALVRALGAGGWLAHAVGGTRWGGAAFLVAYGVIAARRAWAGEQLALHDAAPLTLRAAVAACLAFTYLNPHCWLDTVVLLGAISAQQPAGERWVFGAGACSASIAWFFALGYGARLLTPLFARPASWRVLDGGIALVMWSIAASLIVG